MHMVKIIMTIGQSKIGRQPSKKMIQTQAKFGFMTLLRQDSPMLSMVLSMRKGRRFAYLSIRRLEAIQVMMWFSKPTPITVTKTSPTSSWVQSVRTVRLPSRQPRGLLLLPTIRVLRPWQVTMRLTVPSYLRKPQFSMLRTFPTRISALH